MRLRAIKWTVLAAVASFIWACGGDDSDDGAAGSGGGGGMCSIKACGGDPVGEWTVTDVCVSNPSKLFAATVNADACSAALKSATGIDGSGGYKLGADKNAMSSIVVSGTAMFSFNDACAKALGIGEVAATDCAKIQDAFKKEKATKSATCAAAGANCDCTIASDISLAGSGSYTVSGTEITISSLKQPFCVEGNKLQIETTQSGASLSFTLTKM